MKLYRVTADKADYDTLEVAVVYANDEADAVQIVLAEIMKPWDQRAVGAWWDLEPGAQLSAKPVERKRGPVLAFGTAG